MEAALFMVDSLALIAVLYFSIVNERRPQGTPQTGLFRFVERRLPQAPEPPQRGTWRERRGPR